jgi:spermidine/putrescine transport system permease protein
MARNKSFSVTTLPGFTAIALTTFVLLYAPIVTMVIYSFNDSESVALWGGFSVRWYVEAWDNTQVQEATVRSLVIAVSAALISTTVATMAALGTTRRGRFKGQTLIYVMINQPLMVPEIVTAVALLIFFASIKVATGYTGLAYLILAHSAFCVPFAYLPIRARLEGMDLALEQAAASDLYAPASGKTFRHVTLPLLLPGIAAGAMLAFVVSLDDVIITLMVVKWPPAQDHPAHLHAGPAPPRHHPRGQR